MFTRKTSTDVVIVGSGFAGLCMGIRLKAAGIHSFVILERAAELGGTWRDNDYPGCACDIPSVLYSFSFEPKSDWSRTFPTQPEIFAYLNACARKYGLAPHLRFDTEVIEARYDDARAEWHVETADGPEYVGRFLIAGMGGLSNPYVPAFRESGAFAGPSFHSARWDHGVPLDGRDGRGDRNGCERRSIRTADRPARSHAARLSALAAVGIAEARRPGDRRRTAATPFRSGVRLVAAQGRVLDP
ncbi:MAG: NAD(P)/FAD-dependent oxidoreductase [Candidatus Eremiobacteraeota bacterium]|nr:NAD(P)/FAD-dependent oxidoreductase [Candidatus Eremiobacteraeota bacterium]